METKRTLWAWRSLWEVFVWFALGVLYSKWKAFLGRIQEGIQKNLG